ncbi:hypothetical protein D3C86_1616350 [compost metagenome]
MAPCALGEDGAAPQGDGERGLARELAAQVADPGEELPCAPIVARREGGHSRDLVDLGEDLAFADPLEARDGLVEARARPGVVAPAREGVP